MKSCISNLCLVTLFVFLSVKHALSIKCYDCKTTLQDGTDDVACRDNFGNSLTRECESFVCSIAVETLENGEGSIIRGCGSKPNGSVIVAEIPSADHGQYFDNGTHVSWSTCMTDLCNWDVTLGHRIRRQIAELFHIPQTGGPVIQGYSRDIKCYVCYPNIFDPDDKCTQGKEMATETCHYGGCKIFKFSFRGDDVVVRQCDEPVFQLNKLIPKNKDIKNDKLKRFGVKLSWSTCTTDLCNWGVTNKYQSMTLFVSAMMFVSVYYTLY